MKYEAWASDLGNTRIIPVGGKEPAFSDIAVWRNIFVGTQAECEIATEAFKQGYFACEDGWDD